MAKQALLKTFSFYFYPNYTLTLKNVKVIKVGKYVLMQNSVVNITIFRKGKYYYARIYGTQTTKLLAFLPSFIKKLVG